MQIRDHRRVILDSRLDLLKSQGMIATRVMWRGWSNPEIAKTIFNAKLYSRCSILFLGCAGLQSCVEPLDITPNERESLTLGGEVFSELCSRLALQSNPKDIDGWVSKTFCRADAPVPSDASPDLQALVSERARLISAVDDALVAPLPAELDQVLRDFAPLYDSGQVQTVARSIADVLEAMANDPAVTEALSSMGGRQGYVPPEVAARIIRPLMGYDRLNPLLERSFEAFRTGGYAEAEWQNLWQRWNRRCAMLTSAMLLQRSRHCSDLFSWNVMHFRTVYHAIL